jgi:hypothetical protein
LGVASCALQPESKPPPPTANLSGYPAEFKQGHSDGCASARPNAARMRDEKRMKTDANYAQGWQDGYDFCKRQK